MAGLAGISLTALAGRISSTQMFKAKRHFFFMRCTSFKCSRETPVPVFYDIIYGVKNKPRSCCNLGLGCLAAAVAPPLAVRGPVGQHRPAWSDSATAVHFQDFPCTHPSSAPVSTGILYWSAHSHRARSKKAPMFQLVSQAWCCSFVVRKKCRLKKQKTKKVFFFFFLIKISQP